uniref:Macaca fascicularis brain cDNA clone: QccE-17408, similar to human DiGeorge syndrome critical region gene 2 (DGCR2), mRNA, RefSeq: NM_005137.1 n=1 Tax=Macaca fascicularis TaxID=9541 RepID=I7GHQ4_MACFA|nr:unnamed protein product [Macaca fascicularis]
MSGSFLYMFVSVCVCGQAFAGEGGTWNFAGQWGPTLLGSSTSWAVLRQGCLTQSFQTCGGSTWEAWLKHAVLWCCSGTDSMHSPLDTFSHCGWRPIFSIPCGMRILSYPWTDLTFVPEL